MEQLNARNQNLLNDEARMAELEAKFIALYSGAKPEIIVRAPGRVNLIGEHTDYNDGFVFPAAIERDVRIAASVRTQPNGGASDRQVHAYALNFNQSTTFSLDAIEPAVEPRERWSNYLRAMAFIFQQQGLPLRGMNCVVLGNVPLGSGLSSSAAMLVASGLALAAAGGFEVEPVSLALLAQRAEREFVGVNVGIMDQFISALGQKDHALLIDTRGVNGRPTYEAVPLPKHGISIVIADTNKKRGLVDSEYNTRRAECERAVELLKPYLPGITALRDVSLADFEKFKDLLPEVTRRRARHVVTEDARTLESRDALEASDLPRFGRLMNESHASLRDDYEVSCKELDAMVEAARAMPGVYGARMTGAGFGGCTVSLVADEAVEAFLRDVPPRYRQATGLDATIYVTTAAQGAQRLK